MRLFALELRDFRNHKDVRVPFDGQPTLLLGENGTGKTNLLEALVLLSVGRSFRGSSDRDLTRRGARGFEVRGVARDAGDAAVEIVARGGASGPRTVEIGGAPLPRLSDLVGRFPTVHFSVDDVADLNGSPGGRRRFLDIALCQLEPAALGVLREYGAALRQRNRLLANGAMDGRWDAAQLDAWEEILARSGADLDARRQGLCGELARWLADLGAELDARLEPGLLYAGRGDDRPEADDVEARRRRLEASRGRDGRLGWTSEGPHRARPVCRIAGEDLAGGASRGMSRLYAILLRLALARVFEARRIEPPVLLLDDPESELDPRWIGRILELIPASGQAVVTACRGLSRTPPGFRELAMESMAAVEAAA